MKDDGSRKSTLQKREPWKPEEKAKLAVVIGQVFDMQKQFGKTTGQLENIIVGFCWALADYDPALVIDGLGEYIRNNSDMPTPADIVKLIDPKPPAWKPDKPYYISLKKIHDEQGPYGLDNDEIEYIRRYEEHMRQEMRERI